MAFRICHELCWLIHMGVTPKAFDSSAQGCRACEATLGLQRVALNPARVSRRVRKAWSEISAVDPMSQSEEYLGHAGEPASQPCQGFHRIARHQSHTAAAIQSLRDWEVIITRVLKELLRLLHRTSCRITGAALRTRRETLAGLSAGALWYPG